MNAMSLMTERAEAFAQAIEELRDIARTGDIGRQSQAWDDALRILEGYRAAHPRTEQGES